MTTRKFVIITAFIILSANFFLSAQLSVQAVPAPEMPEGNPIVESNGLSWGIETGIYLDYYLNAKYSTNTTSYEINEPIYFAISFLDEIPDILEVLPAPHYSVHWALNGSQFVLSDYFRFRTTTLPVYSPAIPIGNFSLLTSFFETSIFYNIPPNATLEIIDNAVEWGYEITFDVFGCFVTCKAIYFRSDGSLENSLFEVTYQEEAIYKATLARVTVIDPVIIISIVGIAIFGVLTVVLVVKYIRNPD